MRKQIADAAWVPPFVVFSDATLVEMASQMPGDAYELRSVSGVGEHKLNRYGRAFLDAIQDYRYSRAPGERNDSAERYTDQD